MAAPVSLVTTDGVDLEGEIASAPQERARAVLCHPHPLHGGTMRSLVISELFTALPRAGITCVRFNFRGVGMSTGTHDGGDGERLDVRAAIRALSVDAPDDATPVVVVGWSFGADIALSIHDHQLAGWIGIAPPLRYAHDIDALALDPRPKLILLAERDEIRDAREVAAITGGWDACTTEVVPGASHFFIGRTDRLIRSVTTWVERLAASETAGD
jgi:Predicted hydrolase of the alpha/beta superfamily